MTSGTTGTEPTPHHDYQPGTVASNHGLSKTAPALPPPRHQDVVNIVMARTANARTVAFWLWFFLGGVVMTLTIYVVLGLALAIADHTGGFVDAVQTGFGAIFVLLYFATVLGPLWIFLIVTTLGLRLTRRWIDGPAQPSQLP